MTYDDSAMCSDCGIAPAVSGTLCMACQGVMLNKVQHTCRGCGRKFTRWDGMHATPLDADGELRLQDRLVRSGPDAEWENEPDIISRVICAACCPAPNHDDDVLCHILQPHGEINRGG